MEGLQLPPYKWPVWKNYVWHYFLSIWYTYHSLQNRAHSLQLEKHSINSIPFIRSDQGPVSRKSRKLSGPEKPFVKLRAAYSVKLVFSYVVKGIKIKITAKFRSSWRLSFEDTKRIMSPEMRPKTLGTFEKQAPEPVASYQINKLHRDWFEWWTISFSNKTRVNRCSSAHQQCSWGELFIFVIYLTGTQEQKIKVSKEMWLTICVGILLIQFQIFMISVRNKVRP